MMGHRTDYHHNIQFMLLLVVVTWIVPSRSMEITVVFSGTYRPPSAPSNWGFETTGSALTMAFEDFQRQGWLSDVEFKFIHLKEDCNAKISIGDLSSTYYKSRPDVVFGFVCSRVLLELGLFTANWNLPLFTHGGVNSALGNKSRYDGLIRIHPSGDKMAAAFLDLTRKYNWRRVAMVSSEGYCDLTGPAIRELLTKGGVLVTEFIKTTRTVADYKLKVYLDRIRERARIIIFCIADHESKMRFMRYAYEKGMYPGYVFITFTISPTPLIYEPWSSYPDLTDGQIAEWRNILIKLNYKGATVAIPEGKHIDVFSEQVPVYLAGNPWYFNTSLVNGWKGSYKAVDLYDLAKTYLIVLNETLAEGNGRALFSNGTFLMNKVKGRTVTGLRGKFRYDEHADCIPNLWFWSMAPGQDILEKVAIIKMAEDPEMRFQSIDERIVYWDTLDGHPPIDTPGCGFQMELCQEATRMASILIVTLACLTVVLLAAGVSGYFCKREVDKRALEHLWKVKYQDIMIGQRSLGSVAAFSRRLMSYSMGAMVSSESYCEENLSPAVRSSELFTEIGLYRGIMVAIHRSQKTAIDLTRTVLMELKAMRDMSHDNLVAFVGACIDPPNICYLMMYCQKGSLRDIIENDDIGLDWTFKASLLSDMCNGLSYIHNSDLGSHGSLKSSNCLVDSRWQLKISSYGLHAFQTEQCEDIGGYVWYLKKMWTAPELLRQEDKPRYGTKKGDSYSFAIITNEIIYRTMPFGTQDTSSPKEVIMKVMAIGTEPYRPALGKLPEDVHPNVKDLMRSCWEEDPDKRLSCDGISKYLVEMNEGKKIDIMESIAEKLEKYANNLEDIVSQRTEELINEKKKTDILLYRMLPESIADQLKQGIMVQAELYEEVTIYFSDIVGFTELSLTSTPIQIVDLLNDLYSMFDEMISLHDVYKVETIGDSYMVVSGLPQANGKRHVGEIANLALDLMSAAITNFKIRHKPEMILQLRMGFHTGPCAAGVVGLSMPRYCLFGDTVNMASRMETYGKALRIHVSKDAFTALHALGEYIIIPRGEMHVKGKGLQKTYFLIGKEGYDKPLPKFEE